MDISQTGQQLPQQIGQSTPVQKKTNWTAIIVVALILLASIITAAVYFLLPQKNQEAQSENSASTTSVTDKEQWTTYTDKQYHYSFHYPATWKLENDTTNPEAFVLNYNGIESGEIRGKFLSKTAFNKLGVVGCDPAKIDEQHQCDVYQKTVSSSAFVHSTIENDEPTYVTAYITRPDGTGLSFVITQPNSDSYNTLAIIVDTLKFPNDKRSFPIQICPDSVSVDKKTVTYNSITFAMEDLNQEWIKDNCPNN